MDISRASIAAGLIAVVSPMLSGCLSDNQDSGPLQLAGYGNVLDGQHRPPYFVIDVCADDDELADITITDVSAQAVEGAREPLEFRIAWSDGPKFTRVISSPQPVPPAYVAATGAQGTVSTCGDPSGYAALAVVFPAVQGRPVLVDGVDVGYDFDGDHYVASADVFLVQCPSGTRARAGADPQERPPLGANCRSGAP